MKVSILCFDVSHNCLGRAHLLAQLLERRYEVEIVGARMNGEVWEPVRDDYEYKSVPIGNRIHSSLPELSRLLGEITGDVVYASKPRTTSYGIGLAHAIGKRKPLILDIDDWETRFRRPDRSGVLPYLKKVPRIINVDSYYSALALESLTGVADARTVSNSRLQAEFGGEIIPHARDTDVFDPAEYDMKAARDELDLPAEDTLVMFSGTPNSHKGVHHLVRAVSGIDRETVRAVVVGADDSAYVDRLREIGGEKLIVRGRQPFDRLPTWIAAADVITVPQRRVPKTEGQLPAKVFDAMAMAKPIVATEVSDLPTVLDGCGIVVDPDSSDAIAAAIERLRADPAERERLGRRARERCVERYSYDAVAPRLCDIVREVVAADQ